MSSKPILTAEENHLFIRAGGRGCETPKVNVAMESYREGIALGEEHNNLSPCNQFWAPVHQGQLPMCKKKPTEYGAAVPVAPTPCSTVP